MADQARRDQETMYCHACHHQWQQQGTEIECPACSSASTEIVRYGLIVSLTSQAQALTYGQVNAENDPRHFHNPHGAAAAVPSAASSRTMTESAGSHSAVYQGSTSNSPSNSPNSSPNSSPSNSPGSESRNESGNHAEGTHRDEASGRPRGPPFLSLQPQLAVFAVIVGRAPMELFPSQSTTPGLNRSTPPPPAANNTPQVGLAAALAAALTALERYQRQQHEQPPQPQQHQENTGTHRHDHHQQQQQQPPQPQHNQEQPQGQAPQASRPEILFFHYDPFVTSLVEQIWVALDSRYNNNRVTGDIGITREAYDRLVAELVERSMAGAPRGPPPASQSALQKLESCIRELDDKTFLALSGSGEEGGRDLQCAICVDGMIKGDKVVELPCHHIFHGECVLQWLRAHNTCPLCRRSVEEEETAGEMRKGVLSPPTASPEPRNVAERRE